CASAFLSTAAEGRLWLLRMTFLFVARSHGQVHFAVFAHRTDPTEQSRRAQVDLALGDVGELLVGRLFLLEILLQQVGAVVAAEPLRPGDQRAVARDLVMLDRLRGG